MTIWRMHLRPEGLSPADVVSYCINNGIVGLGWPLDSVGKAENEDEYLERHKSAYGKDVQPVKALLREVKLDDLIWARDAKGGFLLGKVTGSCKFGYQYHAELNNTGKLGLNHVVPVSFLRRKDDTQNQIQDTEVPGRVKASFSSRGSALQRVHCANVDEYSNWLFANKTTLNNAVQVIKTFGDFIDLLDPFDLEDLVVLYMQEQGWRIILSSHAPNTPRYEATFIHRHLGTAGVQVKHKGKDLIAEDYANDKQVNEVFLFAASGNYGKSIPANVKIIKKMH